MMTEENSVWCVMCDRFVPVPLARKIRLEHIGRSQNLCCDCERTILKTLSVESVCGIDWGVKESKGVACSAQVDKNGDAHDLRFMEVSIVKNCPHCGSLDWDTPKKKPDGTICNHPTKFKILNHNIAT